MSLITHAEVVTVGKSTVQSAQLPRPVDGRCLRDERTGLSGGRAHCVGCVYTFF